MKNTILKTTILAAISLLLFSCTKEEIKASLPTLTTATINNITPNSASLDVSITSDGGANITDRGVVWSTNPTPTIALSTKTIDGTGTGTFTGSLTNLTPGTTYYIRAYATNKAGTVYSVEISFTTLDITTGLVAYYPFNGNTNDESGNSHHGINNGALLSADKAGNLNKAYNFNGINSFINTNFIPQTSNQSRTISFYFNADDTTMPNDGYSIISYGANSSDCSQGGGRFEMGIYYNPTINNKSIRLDGVCTAVYSQSTYSSGWHHFSVTYNNSNTLFSNAKIYLDGALIPVNYYQPSTSINTLNLTNFTIGKSPSTSTGRFYKGTIDEIRIYNRTLNDKEIKYLSEH
ncbi:LamG-like jellyroll fold domain-containing protein [Flavobacterium sp.]|uniref:LamG-like jellyroll fold domain-containing protein n=1 Tax=Flavobacterium sp. TaxID=239 RepID=UPI0035B0D14B